MLASRPIVRDSWTKQEDQQIRIQEKKYMI
jgi:hypothetical protein